MTDRLLWTSEHKGAPPVTSPLYLGVGHGRMPDGRHDPGAIASPWVEYDLARDVVSVAAAALTRSRVRHYAESAAGPGHDPNWVGSAAAANGMTASAAVEVHFNASGGSGVEACVHTAATAGWRAWTSGLVRDVAGALELPVRRGDGLWRRSDLGFLRRTTMPAAILEVCFLDHATDRQRLAGVWPRAALPRTTVATRTGEALARRLCAWAGARYVPPHQEASTMHDVTVVYAQRGTPDLLTALDVHQQQPSGLVTCALGAAQRALELGAHVIVVGGPAVDEWGGPGGRQLSRASDRAVTWVRGSTALDTGVLLGQLASRGWRL